MNERWGFVLILLPSRAVESFRFERRGDSGGTSSLDGVDPIWLSGRLIWHSMAREREPPERARERRRRWPVPPEYLRLRLLRRGRWRSGSCWEEERAEGSPLMGTLKQESRYVRRQALPGMKESMLTIDGDDAGMGYFSAKNSGSPLFYWLGLNFSECFRS